VHVPNLVIILYEYPNAIRFVLVDGRPQVVDPDPSWMGTSVGRWEGDTLVIDAIGFNDKTDVHGFMHTEALHVVERFRCLDNGSLNTRSPSKIRTSGKPWTIPVRTFPFRPSWSSSRSSCARARLTISDSSRTREQAVRT
jgi:hypothetical protein